MCILSGDIETGKKLHTIKGGRKGTEARHGGHTTQVLCMAISSDGKYLVSTSTMAAQTLQKQNNCVTETHRCPLPRFHLQFEWPLILFQASGDMNRAIIIWEPDTCKQLYKLKGHRGAVSVSCHHLLKYFCLYIYSFLNIIDLCGCAK